jgi:hypothetical protein
VTNGNITATMTAPNRNNITGLTIRPENQSNTNNMGPSITFGMEPSPGGGCVNCVVLTFTITQEGHTYHGYRYWGSSSPIPNELIMCAHKKDILSDFTHHVKDCIYLLPYMK